MAISCNNPQEPGSFRVMASVRDSYRNQGIAVRCYILAHGIDMLSRHLTPGGRIDASTL